MRALIQRVGEARVRIDGEVVGEIGVGLCVFVGATHSDDAATADRLAGKVWNLRVFADDTGSVPERRAGSVPERRAGVMHRPVSDVGGALLVVSQFTLYADTSRGRRPSWSDAAPPEAAAPLVDAFVAALRERGATVATGVFGADMAVELVNDGPVTILLEA